MALSMFANENGNLRASLEYLTSYFDSDWADIYDLVWGENVHWGIYDERGMLDTAMVNTTGLFAKKSSLTGKHHLLDVGCGFGGSARFAARNFGCRVTAVNISHRQLAIAKTLTKPELPIDFVCCAAESMCFPADTFDVAWAIESLYYSHHPIRFLTRVSSCLKSGGMFILDNLVLERESSDGARTKRIVDRQHLFALHRPEEFRSYLRHSGFEILEEKDLSQYLERTYADILNRLCNLRSVVEERFGASVFSMAETGFIDCLKAAKQGDLGWVFHVCKCNREEKGD